MKETVTAQEKLQACQETLRRLCPNFPKTVIVLGSGLADLLLEMDVEVEIPYQDLPYIAPLTVEGHKPRLIVGKLDQSRVAIMQGRLHFYEGYTMEQVVFPFRVFGKAGAETFLLTNASGGLKSEPPPPRLVLIRDHINLMGTNPLVGANLDFLGPRFPDMTRLYDPELNRRMMQVANRLGVPLETGVYVGVHGPSYETPAEIKMYGILGGDVVGMSTIPEAIALRHQGKRVVCLSCVTNLAAGVEDKPLVHADVLATAKKIREPFARLVKGFLKELV